jgi:hypothetical protein
VNGEKYRKFVEVREGSVKMSTTTSEGRPSADLLSFIADDRAVVIYRPRWNTFTGGMAQTVLLQQIVYWWIKNGRRPFYKFARPCAHRLYRPGDSWEEELSVQRREFENARRGVSARTHGQLDPAALVSYWTDAQRVTWYALNETLLLDHLAALYPAAEVGLQLPLPDLMDETSIRSNGRNVHQDSPAAEELMDETYIGSNGRNVHPLITENKTTPETTPQTPPPSPAAEPPAPPPGGDGGGGDVSAILRWVGFTDRLNDKEQATLDPPTALAWCFFIHLEEAKPTRPKNAVGLARSRWRAGVPPPDDLLALAHSWLALDDDGRRVLLERIDFAARFGADDDFDDDFPGLPVAAAIAIYRATAGDLAPPSLTPIREATAAAIAEVRTGLLWSVPQATQSTQFTPLWRDALVELEMQMTKSTFAAWLRGTSATLADDILTIHLRNTHAVDWVSNRLHDLIARTVAALAGRPLTIRYEVCQ